MIIDCISDLHGFYPKLEGGDLLIVAGDLTARDTYQEYIEFGKWLVSQDYKEIIVIGGNHDNILQRNECFFISEVLGGAAKYLCDSGTEFEGLRIWGSPWSLTFPGMNPKCKAFTVDTEEELAEKWALIPDDIDILITHTPPFGIMDDVFREELHNFEHVGSGTLNVAIIYRPSIKLHVFGHIHESYGIKGPGINSKDRIFVNASHVNERYQPVNKPIRVIL